MEFLFLFLLRYSTADQRCRLETETLLGKSYNPIKSLESTYDVIKCRIEEIKLLLEYSVTIKSISLLLNYSKEIKNLHFLHENYKIEGKLDSSVSVLISRFNKEAIIFNNEKIVFDDEIFFVHQHKHGNAQTLYTNNLHDKTFDFFTEFEYFLINKKINSKGTILELDVVAEEKGMLYLSLFLSKGPRKKLLKYRVPSLPFMGRTSMNVEDSALMTNLCEIRPGMIVYDPCVGSGTLLLHSAQRGCLVVGSDLNVRELTSGIVNGRATIHENFNLMPFLGAIVSDMAQSPLTFADRIVVDIPYGRRISLEGFNIEEVIDKVQMLGDRILEIGGIIGLWVPSDKQYVLKNFEIARSYYEIVYDRSLLVYRKIKNTI